MSHVAHPEDHIALSWRTPPGGSGHRRISPCSHKVLTAAAGSRKPSGGGGGNQVWPGVGAEPPLVVLADELTVRFVSVAGATGGGEGETCAREMATRAWGFRLTARDRKVGWPSLIQQTRERERERALVRFVRVLFDLQVKPGQVGSSLMHVRVFLGGQGDCLRAVPRVSF